MSTVLTSTPLRRRETKTNRGIPTILRASFDGGIAHVSAVDTGLPARSIPWGLRCEAGGSQPGAGPTIRCPTLSGSCPGGPAVPTQHRLGPATPAQRATTIGPGQLASQQCHETPQHPALGRRLWSGPPTSVLRRRTSEPPRSQEAAPRRTSGGGRRPAITTRVARETLCHVDVTVRTVLRWHAFHFQHGD